MSQYYGFWVGDLPARRQAALEAARPILEAEQRLRAGAVPDAQFYETAMLVFGSEEAASAAYSHYLAAKLRAGQTPEI